MCYWYDSWKWKGKGKTDNKTCLYRDIWFSLNKGSVPNLCTSDCVHVATFCSGIILMGKQATESQTPIRMGILNTSFCGGAQCYLIFVT